MKNCYRLLVIGYWLFATGFVNAQITADDWQLIEKQKFQKPEYNNRNVNFLFIGKNPVVRYNPVSLSLGALMFFYQKAISPLFSSKCGYEITCSNFSRRVFQEYGLIKGIALTADRLTRCTQYAVIDINPIYLNDQNKVIDNPGKYRLRP